MTEDRRELGLPDYRDVLALPPSVTPASVTNAAPAVPRCRPEVPQPSRFPRQPLLARRPAQTTAGPGRTSFLMPRSRRARPLHDDTETQ
ncbi:MAG: hypothetical protein ACRDRZ_03025 [Pseudonocardiaceae bacterium]